MFMKKIFLLNCLLFVSCLLYAQTADPAETNAAEPAPVVETKPAAEPEKPKPAAVPAQPDVKPAPVQPAQQPQAQPVQPVTSEETKLLEAIDANPKNWDLYNRLIRLYTLENKRKERLKIALKAIQNIGGSAYLYTIVGDENKFLGDYNKTLISYQFALKMAPNDHGTYNRIGLALLKLSNFNQAEAAFRAAIYFSSGENNLIRGVYYNNLAVAYEAMRDLNNAYKNFQLALKFYPSYSTAVDNLNRVASNMKAVGISPN
jgi:tetratricopeptide (TPR) repeat protein